MMSNERCRLCLDSFSENINIFSLSCEEKHLQLMIFRLFSFWIKPGDISTIICLNCVTLVKQFYNFYGQVKKAQTKITNENLETIKSETSQTLNSLQPNGCFEDSLTYIENIQSYENRELPNSRYIENNITLTDTKKLIKKEKLLDQPEINEYNVADSSLLNHMNPDKFDRGDNYLKIKSDCEYVNSESISNDELLKEKFYIDNNESVLTHECTESFKSSRKKNKKNNKLLNKFGNKFSKSQISIENSCSLSNTRNEQDVSVTDLYFNDDMLTGNLPSEIIRDGKLIIKGSSLDNLINKFYSIQCDICQGTPKFNNLSRLMKHFELEHKTKGYLTCCNTRLFQHRTIYMHMARHLQPSAFECPICKKTVSRPHSLKSHLQTHLPESEKPHKCDQCDRRFSYSEGLASHKLTHIPVEKRSTFDCQICGKIFTLYSSFSTHIRTVHSGAKYLCSQCGKSFQRKTELTFHMLTHDTTGKYKVQCQICGFMCKNKPTLRIHMKRHAVERLHCSMCEYTTHRRQQLNIHMRVKHSDEKPFICVVCGKQFKLKSVLRAHVAQHTGEHKFSCSFCPKTFVSPGNYLSHRKRVHPDDHKNYLDNKHKEKYVNLDDAEFHSTELETARVHQLAREYLRKIEDQNVNKVKPNQNNCYNSNK